MTVPRPVTNPWLRIFKPQPAARVRLFCLPFAGGGTTPFFSWPARLPPDVELVVVCLPGREDRRAEPPYQHLPPLVTSLAQAVAPLLDRPFVLYGHSMGALVAFELARTLRALDAPAPARLIVSARGAPDRPGAGGLATLPDDRFVAEVNRRYNGIPSAVLAEPELLAMLLPLLRADLALLEGYRHEPGPPLTCPLTAVGGSADPNVHEADLEAWRAHSSGPFRRALLAGDHFFIQSNPAPFFVLLNDELAHVR